MGMKVGESHLIVPSGKNLVLLEKRPKYNEFGETTGEYRWKRRGYFHDLQHIYRYCEKQEQRIDGLDDLKEAVDQIEEMQKKFFAAIQDFDLRNALKTPEVKPEEEPGKE